jgi:Flp pilus assembly protein CpaB
MARISTGTMTVGIFAVLFGLVGAYALRAALVGEAPPPPPAPRTVVVPLAAHDLPAGRMVQQGDMVLLNMTQADMEARKFDLTKTMLAPEQIIGRLLEEGVNQGQPFITTNMYLEGTGPKLADKLKPGMRAITIPIDNLAAVGGRTVEGSFVDVLFKSKSKPADLVGGKPEIPETTVTLLENVEVLSVGRIAPSSSGPQDGTLDVRQINGRSSGPSGIVSVTIAVTPDQANVVKAVLGQGDMSLALRGNPGDGASTPNKYTLEGILGVSARTQGFDRMEIFRGGWSRQTVNYQNNHVIKNEFSVVPGLAPSTPFPVPATIPQSTKGSAPATDPSYRPSPNFYHMGGWGGGGGYGGYGGYGYGGFGGAYNGMSGDAGGNAGGR